MVCMVYGYFQRSTFEEHKHHHVLTSWSVNFQLSHCKDILDSSSTSGWGRLMCQVYFPVSDDRYNNNCSTSTQECIFKSTYSLNCTHGHEHEKERKFSFQIKRFNCSVAKIVNSFLNWTPPNHLTLEHRLHPNWMLCGTRNMILRRWEIGGRIIQNHLPQGTLCLSRPPARKW